LDGARANVLSSGGDWHPEAAVLHWSIGRTRRRAVIASAAVDDDPRCRSCDAACCRSFASVPITWAEYERLHDLGARRLELSLRGHHRLVVDGACEFLVFGRCSIYAERPEICRRFICVEP
jgi:uncharacterized protein